MTFTKPPLARRGDLVVIAFGFLVAYALIGGRVFLRLAALAAGDVVSGELEELQTETTLKGRRTDVLVVSFAPAGGERRRAAFPIGFTAARGFAADPNLVPPPEVAYLPAFPAVAGLVDDFGYTSVMLKIFAAVPAALTLITLIAHHFRSRKAAVVR